MAKWWVQLRQCKLIEEDGRVKSKRPGDWVSVGKRQAQKWIDEGSAWIPDSQPTGSMPTNSGVLFLGGPKGNSQSLVEYYGDDLEWCASDEPSLPWPRTLIWDASFRLRLGLIPNGFHLLNRWQLAVPLWKYNDLALRFGSDEERERTKAIIRDLRVMVYDCRCLFVKRCGDTERLIEMWASERSEGSDKLAFLRALYVTKPLICALPVSWGSMGDR